MKEIILNKKKNGMAVLLGIIALYVLAVLGIVAAGIIENYILLLACMNTFYGYGFEYILDSHFRRFR